jgi:hypothetical protein
MAISTPKMAHFDPKMALFQPQKATFAQAFFWLFSSQQSAKRDASVAEIFASTAPPLPLSLQLPRISRLQLFPNREPADDFSLGDTPDGHTAMLTNHE